MLNSSYHAGRLPLEVPRNGRVTEQAMVDPYLIVLAFFKTLQREKHSSLKQNISNSGQSFLGLNHCPVSF